MTLVTNGLLLVVELNLVGRFFQMLLNYVFHQYGDAKKVLESDLNLFDTHLQYIFKE